MSLHGQMLVPNSDLRCQLACSGPNPTLKRQMCAIRKKTKVAFTQDIKIFGANWGVAPSDRVSNRGAKTYNRATNGRIKWVCSWVKFIQNATQFLSFHFRICCDFFIGLLNFLAISLEIHTFSHIM